MTLQLHYHPLASYCWKVLIALYDNATPFEPRLLDLGDAAKSAAFKRLWPMGKMPVLVDNTRGRTVPEASVVTEYLQTWYPGPTRFIPEDPECAERVRLRDRVLDLYVHNPMQAIVGDRLRPADKRDAFGVEEARTTLRTAYRMLNDELAAASAKWGAGETFSLADCSALPALFYGKKVEPFAGYPALTAYLERLKLRPSVARVLEEAEPYMKYFPE